MNKNKSSQGSAHLVIIIVLVVAVIGVLGFVLWQNFLRPSDSSNVVVQNVEDQSDVVFDEYDESTDKVAYISFGGSTSVIKDASQIISNKYSKGNVKIQQNPTDDQFNRDTGSAVDYNVAGTNYYVVSDESKEFIWISRSDLEDADWDGFIQPIYNELNSYFESNKYQKIIGQSKNDNYYLLNDTICMMTREYLVNGLQLSCDSVKNLQLIADKVKPLRDAMTAIDDTDYSENLFINGSAYSNPNIVDSKLAGYQIASMIGWGTQGLPGTPHYLYKKDGGVWTYFAYPAMQG